MSTESNDFSLGIRPAKVTDCDELLALYISIYGDDYPLEIGTNKTAMINALKRPEIYRWFVMYELASGSIVGSSIFELDLVQKIGKVTGVVVHNSKRNKGVAQKLIAYGSNLILDIEKSVYSLYATSRTLSLGSQQMLLKNGFFPLGIFPNARKIKTYETLTLMGKFSKGVLENREIVKKIPRILAPIAQISAEILGQKEAIVTQDCPSPSPVKGHDLNEFGWGGFEFIEAAQFVSKRFDQVFKDDIESQFYPFHRPNLLIASKVSNLEIYATFSRKDHYCVLITANQSFREMKESFKGLIFSMKEIGIYYVEVLVKMDNFETLCFFANNKFIPSAIYPAMREENGRMQDYVLLTRTMVPLDFSEMNIAPEVRPYLRQYTEEWLKMNHVAAHRGL